MKAYRQLTLAQLRLFGRNRQVLFWTLVFPIFFMVMLGSFLGKGDSTSLSVTVIDQDQTTASKALLSSMKQLSILKLTESTDLNAAMKDLKHGDRQLVVAVPKGYEAAVSAKSASMQGSKLTVYFDETSQTTNQIGLPIMSQIADGISKQIVGYTPVVTIQSQAVQSLNLKYIDFLVPGIVAMMIMSNNLNGVAGQIASWRERGILRRLQSTPLQPRSFIAAQITARLLLNGAQAMIVLLIGSLIFGTQVNGSWILLLMFVILGTLTFMSIGFIIAALAKTPESAGPIAGFVSFPLLFLGGVFFPIKNMPDWLQPVVKLLPISHLSSALRQIMNVGASLADVWREAALLGGWMLVAFIIASLTFKWE
ncbi:ABC-2 type transport system permease protein [Paenibacillus sp. V4I3]|uniref:ABC transporter permease n=1 Tax=Paenibacillus sp. V4I3 TaxID=3042305 RepID=UPI00278A05C3|nr:ABC transporter permease [Paenibacillus sp. V4I3]MDQ0878721.1 ABC-2 type transport system permease protein [Paenibacillus sp. V4I3]